MILQQQILYTHAVCKDKNLQQFLLTTKYCFTTPGKNTGAVILNIQLMQVIDQTKKSFTKFVNGTYQVNIPGHPLTEGTYGTTGSYTGMSYVFMPPSKYKL